MKFRSLRDKLLLLIVAYTVSAFSLSSIVIYKNLQNDQVTAFQKWVRLRHSLWKTFLLQELMTGRAVTSVKGTPREGGQWEDGTVDEAIAVFSDTGRRVHTLQPGKVPEVLSAEIALGAPYISKDGIAIVSPLNLGFGHGDYAIYSYFSFPSGNRVLGELYRVLAWVAAALVFMAVLLALAVHAAVLKPIGAITRATVRTAEGELNQKVRIQTGDEFELLSERFEAMLAKIREMQQIAKDSSPLTGLPGNNSIRTVIDKALADKADLAVCYVDINHFKAYNDVYGFDAGDKAILHTAWALECTLGRQVPEGTGFLGHVGGDDFIAVVPGEKATAFAEAACAEFDRGALGLYSPEDVKRAGIVTLDRQGVERKFPIMSISIAGVSLGGERFTHCSEVAIVAAELKKLAKMKPGSAFVMDRRQATAHRLRRA